MSALNVLLRPAGREDLEAIVALDRATDLAPHWAVSAYAEILDASGTDAGAPRRCLIVAERSLQDETVQATGLAGFAVAVVQPAASAGNAGSCLAELEDVVVATDCQRRGVGRALCADVLSWCRLQGATEVSLEVRAANAGAVALYGQLGFREVGCRPRYYCDPNDHAVVMSVQLIPALPCYV